MCVVCVCLWSEYNMYVVCVSIVWGCIVCVSSMCVSVLYMSVVYECSVCIAYEI